MSDNMIESIQEELTCSICFDIFENPVIIGKCTHTFCYECIKGCISSKRKSVACPLCRKVYKIVGDQFQKNMYVQNIIDKMKEKGAIPKESAPKERKTEVNNTIEKDTKVNFTSGTSYSGFASNIISNNFNSLLFDKPGSNIL